MRTHAQVRKPASGLQRAPLTAGISPGHLTTSARVRKIVGGSQVQAKLTVGLPGDAYEREADRIANAVLRMPEPMPEGDTSSLPLTAAVSSDRSAIQHRCPQCEEEMQHKPFSLCPGCEAGMQRQPMEEPEEEGLLSRKAAEESDEEKETLQAKESPGDTPRVTPEMETRIGALRGSGSPLPVSERSFFEPRFGSNFGGVRIHTGPGAADLAQRVQARAFTVGQDIWFAKGEFSTTTPSGRGLLAHELVHTIQQGRAASPESASEVQRSICPGSCADPVGRGELCQADEVTRDNCGERDEVNTAHKISHIRVLLSARKVHLFWNGQPKTDTGTREELDCTPNAATTPRGRDVVGTKCGENHTSWEKYNMAWFTALRSTVMRYGFHDSQPLGGGFHSSGCIRVSCEDAHKINQNTKSGWTSVEIL